MNVGLDGLAQALIRRAESNPDIMQDINNNQMKRGMFEALKSGNVQRGQELARNYANSCGMTPQQMAQHSLNFFQKTGS